MSFDIKVGLQLVALSLSVVASARADAASNEGEGQQEDVAAVDEADTAEARRTARAYDMLPSGVSPRVGEHLVTGHFWGGYDGGARGAVGEATVDGRITRFLAIRVGGSSSDLYGRPTATLGARVGILREGTAPVDLSVGVFYQPQSIRGDGNVIATGSLGKTIGRLSSQATIGYGQDPEADDGLALASLGAVLRMGERFHAGLHGRMRTQLWSTDKKFVNLEQPMLDFCAGPLLAYSMGAFDIMAQGGIAGLLVKPPEIGVERTSLRFGPMLMFGVGTTL
jgi:hypothetical protein